MISRFAPTTLAPHRCPLTGRGPSRPALRLLPVGRHVTDELLRDSLSPASVGQSVEGPRTCQQSPPLTLARRPPLPLPCDSP
eukprot:936763-Rhodomonas_salina.1